MHGRGTDTGQTQAQTDRLVSGVTDQAPGLDTAIFDASIDHSLLQAGRVDYLDVAAYVPALSERAVSLLPADCVRDLALHEVNIV